MATHEKGKRKTGWIIVAAVVIMVGFVGATGWYMLQKEHEEARSVIIQNIDFSEIPNGTYKGYYAGGMYGWRENEVQVTVEKGKVTSIDVLYSKSEIMDGILEELYSRVISEQSLDVDAVSQASLTTKAYLKSVEDALGDDAY